MSEWLPISDKTPYGVELDLWLRAEEGNDTPIGRVIAMHTATPRGDIWVEKSVAKNLNGGLRADLITHYRLPPEAPNDRPIA